MLATECRYVTSALRSRVFAVGVPNLGPVLEQRLKNLLHAFAFASLVAVPLLMISTSADAATYVCVKYDKKGHCVQKKLVK